MIAAGRLPAVKTQGKWVVDELVAPSHRRPLSERSRAALAQAMQTRSLHGLSGQERARTAARLRELRASPDPAQLLVDWWGGGVSEVRDQASSLVAMAALGDRARVYEAIHRPRREYLRKWGDLADVVGTERTVLGDTRQQLAERAGVPTSIVTAIERAKPVASPASLRRVLKAINIEASALPDLEPT